MAGSGSQMWAMPDKMSNSNQYVNQMMGLYNIFKQDQNKWQDEQMNKLQNMLQNMPSVSSSYQPAKVDPVSYTPATYTPSEWKPTEYKPAQVQMPDMNKYNQQFAGFYDQAAHSAADYAAARSARAMQNAAGRTASAMAARGLGRSTGPQSAAAARMMQEAAPNISESMSNIYAQSGNAKAGAMADLAKAMMQAEIQGNMFNAGAHNDWNKTNLGYKLNWDLAQQDAVNKINLANAGYANQTNLANAGYANQWQQALLDADTRLKLMAQQALLNQMYKTGGDDSGIFAAMMNAAAATYGRDGGSSQPMGMSGFGGGSVAQGGGGVSMAPPTMEDMYPSVSGPRKGNYVQDQYVLANR